MADEVIAGHRARPLQMRRVGVRGWTKARRARFLEHLAATCNVRASCEAIDAWPNSAYLLRRRDPVFAELWEEALEAGYVRLETALLSRALGDINAIEPGDDAPGGDGADAPLDVELALRLLGRRGTSSGKGARPSRREMRRHVATEAETDAALLKKLAVLRRQIANQLATQA